MVLLVLLVLLILPVTVSPARILQHLLGIDVILLGFQVAGIAQQGRLVHIDGVLPVFLLRGGIAGVVAVLRRHERVLDGGQRLERPLEVLLPVLGGSQVVARGHGHGVLDQRLAVVDLRFLELVAAELAVAGPHVVAVCLREGGQTAEQQQDGQ